MMAGDPGGMMLPPVRCEAAPSSGVKDPGQSRPLTG
jgi:hypothetical protein